MIFWDPDGTNGGDGWLVVGAILLGCIVTHLMEHGLPTWWPDPASTAAILLLAAFGLFALIVARRWR